FLQFYKFLGDLMTGNWGISVSISQGTPVANLFMTNFPSMIEIGLLPIALGIIVGVLLGKVANRYRGKWVDKTIHVIYILGISFPPFFLGMLFQYGIFVTDSPLPIIGWKNPIDPTPPMGAGFRIYDAILANQSYLVGDIILHYLIPRIILFIATFTFITRQTRSMQENKSYGSSVILNTVITGNAFGFIVMSFFTVDLLFNLSSFSNLFLMALSFNEYWVLRVCLFAIILEFAVITFVSDAIFILYKFVIKNRLGDKFKKKSRENVSDEDQHFEISHEETLKSYLKSRLKSPLFIIGIFLVIFFVLSAIFPRLITQYTYHEAQYLGILLLQDTP
ncbi:MAG: ABC transporter permease subunit, partial [Candidatus Thorarchaeota archaeon]